MQADDEDGFDFEIPEELCSWIDSQREQSNNFLNQYIFVNGKIKPATFMEWALWFNNPNNRKVDWTDLTNEVNYPGGEMVSTIFLGIDHAFLNRKQLPVLFETMIFGGKYDQRMWRYCTCGQAKRGHSEIVEALRAGQEPEVTSGNKPFIDYWLQMWREEDEDD